MRRRASLIVGVATVFLAGCFDSSAQTMFEACQTDRTECLTEKILAYADEHPEKLGGFFADVATMLKEGSIPDDPRTLSPIVHATGMELAHNDVEPEDAFEWCGTSFKQGCMHGFMMEYVELLPSAVRVGEMFPLCDFASANRLWQRNCIHAIGHEIAAKLPADLPTLLEACDGATFGQDCASGVMMEYSTGNHGTGHHSHQRTGVLALPCAEVQERYQTTCYATDAAYAQYLPGGESFDATATRCMNVPSTFRHACMLGLVEKMFTAAAEDMHETEGSCLALSDAAAEEECLSAAREIVWIESVL